MNPIHSLTIRNRTFATNLIPGPLAGTSNAAYRALIWQYSTPAFSYSEMIAANALVNQPARMTERFLKKDPQEGPVCFQLFGNDAENLAAATKIATAAGADLIDLNCGCSIPKIRKNGAGSSLLRDLEKLATIISAMRKQTDLPLIIKVRISLENTVNLALIETIVKSGADAIVVHGRTWQDTWGTPCRHEAIEFFVKNSPLPIIGNGDIRDLVSLKQMGDTGCAGMMISRAMIGQPWLLEELTCTVQGKTFTPPTLPQLGLIFKQHITALISYLDNERTAILQARMLARGYAKKLPQRKAFCEQLNQTTTYATFAKLCDEYYGSSDRLTA